MFFYHPRNELNGSGDSEPSEFRTDPHMMHKKVRSTVYCLLTDVNYYFSTSCIIGLGHNDFAHPVIIYVTTINFSFIIRLIVSWRKLYWTDRILIRFSRQSETKKLL